MNRTCSKCLVEKDILLFPKRKGGRDGVRSYCRECKATQDKNYVKLNIEKLRIQWKEYLINHRQEAIERARIWKTLNRDRVNLSIKKTRSTVKGKLNIGISNRIRRVIKPGTKKEKGWEKLVNFTLADLTTHLENQFNNGMTWDNYGVYWHIDHKIPISVFNFETPDDIDFKRCWDLNNLQPMIASENLSKAAKLEIPFQPSLLLTYNNSKSLAGTSKL